MTELSFDEKKKDYEVGKKRIEFLYKARQKIGLLLIIMMCLAINSSCNKEPALTEFDKKREKDIERLLDTKWKPLAKSHSEELVLMKMNSINDALRLAYSYNQRKMHSHAERVYRLILRFQLGWGSPYDQNIGDIYLNIAEACINQKKYEEAETQCRFSLSEQERQKHIEHPDLAWPLEKLAWVLQKQKKFNEVEPLYKRAIAILEKSKGFDHQDLYPILISYGLFLEKTRRRDEAFQVYSRASTIAEK